MNATIASTILSSMFIMLPALGNDRTEDERNSWTEYQRNRIEAVGDEPSYEQIRMLCDLAASDSETENANEIRPVAWARLQQIPDFPDRILHHVTETRKKWQAGEVGLVTYDRARGWGLSPLGKLPVPASVRVLGEFLYDDELPGHASELEAAMNGGSRPNNMIAIRALGRLVEKPPVQGDPENYTRDDVRAWQLWFEQVKAGNRTFRFKGNPQEYNLAGPALEALAPVNAGSRDLKSAAEQASAGNERKFGFPIAAIVTAIGLLAIAIGAVVRRMAVRS